MDPNNILIIVELFTSLEERKYKYKTFRYTRVYICVCICCGVSLFLFMNLLYIGVEIKVDKQELVCELMYVNTRQNIVGY